MSEVVKKLNRFQQALVFEVSNFEKIFVIEDQFKIIEKLWKGR